jgi:hypothetical protein
MAMHGKNNSLSADRPIPRYRPDEFMSEVTTVFPYFIPLSGAREHIRWFLNPFCFLLWEGWELHIN